MRKIAKVSAATLAFLLGSAGVAVADTTDTVPVTVQGGALSVAVTQAPSFLGAIGSKDFYGRPFIAADEIITITDYRGTGAGYSVTQTITDVVFAGDATNASTIQPSNFKVSGGNGQIKAADSLSVSQNAPSVVPVAGGDLGAGQVVLQALPGGSKGMGAFEVGLTMALTVPPTTLAGDYTATLTTSVVSGDL